MAQKVIIRSQIPPQLYERLREYAYEKHFSMAKVIWLALDDYLPKVKKRPSL